MNAVTFEIEKVEKATNLLKTVPIRDILIRLFLSDIGKSRYDSRQREKLISNIFVTNSSKSDNLIDFGYHAFFNGMHCAYAEHRPFVISPDMIWLLISQGFANHVKNNSEALRNQFVDFDKKLTLIVNGDEADLENPESSWEQIFQKFIEEIKIHVGEELINALTADFSTTTITEKIASQITILKAVESYFEFCILYGICGIPELTIEGNPEDWEKIIKKANALRKYNLDWWINELDPILNEFLKASKNVIDKSFWLNIFKYHTLDEYGAPDIVDGWILKFFPYDKQGNRRETPIEVIKGLNVDLPDEIVKVDVEHIKIGVDGSLERTMLELWAGFVGLEQNTETLALRPKIGWAIKNKNQENIVFKTEFAEGHKKLRVNKFPRQILDFPIIKSLDIEFTDRIEIPEEMKDVKIEYLALFGKISWIGELRTLKILKNTELRINHVGYINNGNSALLVLFLGKLKSLKLKILYLFRDDSMLY